MKSLVLISLIALICSKYSVIEYGKEYTFDKSNNQFEFTAEKDGLMFIHVLFEGSSTLSLAFGGDGVVNAEEFKKPGYGMFRKIEKDKTYMAVIQYPDGSKAAEEKGTIWLNPSWHELKVDLNKIYEWFDYSFEYAFESSLIYSIDNAEKDVTFNFTYSKKLRQDLPNPFEVCLGQECKKDLEKYDIKKGQSYKIYAKVIKMKDGSYDKYYLPTYKFGELKYVPSYSFNLKTNPWLVSLLLLLFI